MSAHYIPCSSTLVDGAEPAVGAVYASRRCNRLARPSHGRTGWRATLDEDGRISSVEVFFYGKGGFARWLTRIEFERVKEERAAVWRLAHGRDYHREKLRRWERIESLASCVTGSET